MKKILIALIAGLFLSFSALAAVDLNKATQSELEGVKGIGPVKAKAIIDYRTKNGSFKSIDELDKVPGFGKATVDKVKAEVSVGSAPAAAKADKPAKDVKAAAPAAPAAPAAAPAAKDKAKK